MRSVFIALVFCIAACAPEPRMSLTVEASRSGRSGSTADIVKFCRLNEGRKVGDGQCWSLANESFKATGKTRPGSDLHVWGRKVNFANESIKAGGIIEYESASFSDGVITGRNHTAVVITGGSADHFTVAEQNFRGGKKVTVRQVDLSKLQFGKVTVYRPL